MGKKDLLKVPWAEKALQRTLRGNAASQIYSSLGPPAQAFHGVKVGHSRPGQYPRDWINAGVRPGAEMHQGPDFSAAHAGLPNPQPRVVGPGRKTSLQKYVPPKQPNAAPNWSSPKHPGAANGQYNPHTAMVLRGAGSSSTNTPINTNTGMMRHPTLYGKGKGGGGMDGWVMAGTIGGGALIGGGASYATGGNFWQGAAMGAVGGGAVAGMTSRRAGNAMAKAINNAGFTGKPNEFAQSVIKQSQALTNTEARRAMIMGGGLLGGFTFGGNKSHKRGFNSNRGNSIGR